MQFDGAPPGVFSSRTPLGSTGSFLSLTLRPPDVTRDAVLKARNVTELETIVFLRFFFVLVMLRSSLPRLLANYSSAKSVLARAPSVVLKDKDKALSSSADSHYL